MNKLRVFFAGTPTICLPTLHALQTSKYDLIGILTQPDRPAGRGQKQQISPVKAFALSEDIPCFQPETLRDDGLTIHLQNLEPDIFIVMAYGLFFPKTLLNFPTFGAINIHASILPRFRGASPIQQAILEGDQETGITIMQMDEGMDTGDILGIKTCLITDDDTTETLSEKLAYLAPSALLPVLEKIASLTVIAEKQDAHHASYAKKIKKEHAIIHWNEPALKIHKIIRAFNPWPIAYTILNNEILRIFSAVVIHESPHTPPGTIEHIDKTGLYVSTSENILCIKMIQFPGGKKLDALAFSNHQKIKTLLGKRFLT